MIKFKSVSKRMLSLLMAMLMLCSGMAVASAASADDVPAPVCTIDSVDRTITVAAIAPVTVDGQAYDVAIEISPAVTTRQVLESGDTFFYNLAEGTTYTVTAKITVDGQTYTKSAEPVSFKKASATPAAPVVSELTSSTIAIKNVSGCEYRIEKSGENEASWDSLTKFTGLTPETAYDIYIRVKETDKAYASTAAKITVKTLKAAEGEAPAAPVLIDQNMTTIIVEEIDGIVFSTDKKNWQVSGTFTGLKAGQTYSVYAMKKYDPKEQDANPISKALVVVTNTKPNSPASLDDCTISVGSAEYTNSSVPISVKVKSTYVTFDAQYGDTIYIPTHYQVNNGEKVIIADVQGTTFKASFVPGDDNANKDINVTIYYAKMKYIGSEIWVTAGEETSSVHKVSVGPVYNGFLVFFEKIANFFLNTVPAYINDFIKSDAVTGFFDFFLGLGKSVDFEKLLGGLVGSLQ